MTVGTAMRGTMVWFNAAKDRGVLRTDGGDQIDVPGGAFAPGQKPVERCAGKAVAFTARDGIVSAVAFLPEVSPRRARMRHRRSV
jgi:hypothetical protein